tara:strand:- start:378 stop:959 length:582 start_codon:yes stop_codon:yes gene_type:complete
MVKNKTGGNKSKKSARKFTNPAVTNRKLRLAEEDETYAVVLKLFGGQNCQVVTNDGVTRLCVIRNKFRGRDKRDNNIAPGVWILVGVREWEARTKGEKKCDLLEVYNSIEKEKLKAMTGLNLAHIIQASEGDDIKDSHTDIIFEDDNISENKNKLQQEILDADGADGADSADGADGADAGADSDDDFIDVDEI